MPTPAEFEKLVQDAELRSLVGDFIRDVLHLEPDFLLETMSLVSAISSRNWEGALHRIRNLENLCDFMLQNPKLSDPSRIKKQE